MTSDLAARRREQTRAEIADAAVELFLAKGFDATTMDDVAEASGVSRRTAYRYFPAKDELVFEQPRRWIEAFTVAIEQNPEESSRDRIRRGIIEVAGLLEESRESVLKAFSVLTATPSLAGRHGKGDTDWRLIIAGVVAIDLGDSPAAQLETAVIAGALIGTTNALIAAWAAAQPGAAIVEMTVDALDQIDSIWPPATR